MDEDDPRYSYSPAEIAEAMDMSVEEVDSMVRWGLIRSVWRGTERRIPMSELRRLVSEEIEGLMRPSSN